MSPVFDEAYDLGGRVAIVTGAGSGIGRASAELLARAGATVVATDIDGDAARATAKGATRVEAATLDVSDGAAVAELVDGVVAGHGRLDVMANIAGIMQSSTVLETTEADLDRVHGVNFKGVFFASQAAARHMVAAGRGSIVNMASGAVDVAVPGLVCYATAKAALVQLTKTLATEVGPAGVRVNAVAPGFVETAMTGRHFTEPDGTVDEERRRETLEPMAKRAPLRRVGQPDDIAHAVLYLASDAASFVTGQVLRPNGGVAMP